MNRDTLLYLYQEEYMDLYKAKDGMGALIWEDLIWWDERGEHKVEAFKLTDVSTFEELEYFERMWPKHKQNVELWLNWFQRWVSQSMDIDSSTLEEEAQERWDAEDIDHDDYEDFDEYWEEYEGSNAYYDEINFLQDMVWDDIKDTFKGVFEIINDSVNGKWFDSYNNLMTRSMDSKLEEAFDKIDDIYNDFINSKYDPDDMSYDELTELFDGLFE